METINPIELGDENIYPNHEVLKSILGEAFQTYLELLDLFDKHGMHYEWRNYQDGKAWLCKVQKKKRTVLWMSAWRNFMQVTIYFPVRLLDEVLNLDLSHNTKDKILRTKNVGKSKPCIFEVYDINVLKDLEKVMKWKMGT